MYHTMYEPCQLVNKKYHFFFLFLSEHTGCGITLYYYCGTLCNTEVFEVSGRFRFTEIVSPRRFQYVLTTYVSMVDYKKYLQQWE